MTRSPVNAEGTHRRRRGTAQPVAEIQFGQSMKKPIGASIRLLVVDVDGTLTDGGMYYGEDGEFLKRFNTRDGAAIEYLQKKNIEIVVCTGENSPAVRQRMIKLNIENCFMGIKHKVKYIDDWLKTRHLTWQQVCYIGDELNDKEIMQLAAISICPSDAHPAIKKTATFELTTKGGEGVMREVALLLEEKNFLWKKQNIEQRA